MRLAPEIVLLCYMRFYPLALELLLNLGTFPSLELLDPELSRLSRLLPIMCWRRSVIVLEAKSPIWDRAGV